MGITNGFIGIFLILAQSGNLLCSATAIRDNGLTSQFQKQQLTRIFGGVETGLHEFPYMAALFYLHLFQCGATIISNRFSITAAHCIEEEDIPMYLVVGDHDLYTDYDTPESVRYKVDSYEKHPGFDDSTKFHYHDIAILRTATQIIFTANIGPVSLPFRYTNKNFTGEPVTALGWGITESGFSSKTLKKIQVNIISNNHCNAVWPNPIIEKDICTYADDQNMCPGDSGGPVLWLDTTTQRYILVGVISYGFICPPLIPTVNIRVTEYLQWIVNKTGNSHYIK